MWKMHRELYITELFLLFLSLVRAGDSYEATVETDAPPGWLVADLQQLGWVKQSQTLFIQEIAALEQGFFAANKRSQIVVAKDLRPLKGSNFTILIRSRQSKPIPLKVYVIQRSSHFTQRDYRVRLLPDYANGELLSDETISLVSPDDRLPVHFNVISHVTLPLEIVTKKAANGSYYAEVHLHRTSRSSESDLLQELFIAASSAMLSSSPYLATARLQILPSFTSLSPPRFQTAHYALDLPEIRAHQLIVHVTAVSHTSPVSYHLDRVLNSFTSEFDSKLVEVSPLTGHVFAKRGFPPDSRHFFAIVARDAFGEEARATVLVHVRSQDKGPRNRRDSIDTDTVITVKENNKFPVLFRNILPLDINERVIPVSVGPLNVYANGTIEVAAGLNYESSHEHRVLAVSYGHSKSRRRQIRLVVEDEDEPPAFVNEPRPLLAVISPTTPIGFHVYKFDARDELGEGSSEVMYHLINSEPSGFFTVDPLTGAVRSARAEYPHGETFRLFVEAVDRPCDGKNITKNSDVAVLEVLAADRPPQFLKQHYTVSVREDSLIDASVVDARAQSFRSVQEGRKKGPITYSLRGSNGESNWFRIDPMTGIVHLSRELDYDEHTHTKTHQLTVVASEDGKQSSAPLTINVADVNDNAPQLSQPLYTAHIKEDFPPGETILKVNAKDKDSGVNAKIRYSVSDGNFTIDENGEIRAAKRLDADQMKERFYVYKFTVTATDEGTPQLSSTAQVHVRTENTNDEAPVFLPTAEYTAYVAEDAQGGTPVVQVQARDADRDQVMYFFDDKHGKHTTEAKLFQIDKDTGLIRLKSSVSAEDLMRNDAPYNLTIIAKDDGSCCPGDSKALHITRAIVRIGIEDVNNNKPEFKDCSSYSKRAKLKEGSYKTERPVIIKVVATDEDSSANGQIVYSLYHSQSESRKPFTIDPLTGELFPSPHVVFDRETRARDEVTVKATDRGDRPLIGFCQFTVEIEDVNDNAPVFDRESYQTSISRHEAIGSSILSVAAVDADAAPNARVTYSLAADFTAGEDHLDDVDFVSMLSEESGEILLARPIPAHLKKEELRFLISATDNGDPFSQSSTAPVTILLHDSHQKSPVWKSSALCPNTVRIKENSVMNQMILRCLATPSRGSSIMYKLVTTAMGQSDPKADTKFRHFNQPDPLGEAVKVFVMESLDHETAHNYTLTLTATDMSSFVSSSRTFTVLVEDENDSVPAFTVDLFTGTIDEELSPLEYENKFGNKPIAVVHAVDADSPGPQSEVHYSIIPKKDGAHKLFRIDEITGGIYPLSKLDREVKDEYILTVQARDNNGSSLPGVFPNFNTDTTKVRIVVADVNDNAPYFNESRYEARVTEDTEIGHAIVTVKAHDLDRHSKLRYDLSDLNGKRLMFGVRTDSGQVFVKEPLDFEKDSIYELLLYVSDGKHNATTHVRVNVEDVNDNAPHFEQSLYEITLNEEDPDVPKTIFTVKATDEDGVETNGDILYRLEGQGAGDLFKINERSGEIDVVSSLDRDPPRGVPTWKLVVHAVDQGGKGLVGYADIQVNLRDINDNAPMFPDEMFGYLDENRPVDSSEGVFVMIVQATDLDDPATENSRLEYSIAANKWIDDEPVFRIEPSSGKIFAMRSLDRESPGERELQIEVRATDGGRPPREGMGNVTIRVRDKNDNPPYFDRRVYESRVSESAPLHSAILSISAMDADDEDPDNKLSYSLVEDGEWWDDFFYMTTEADSSSSSVGVLRLKQVFIGLQGPWPEKQFPPRITQLKEEFAPLMI